MKYAAPSFEAVLLRRKAKRLNLRELEYNMVVVGMFAAAVILAQSIVGDVQQAHAYQEHLISVCEDMVRNADYL